MPRWSPHGAAPPDLFGSVEPLLAGLREDGVAVWVLGAGPYPPGAVALQELLDAASEELQPEDVWEPEDMNDTCLYIFTSGTTGALGPEGASGGVRFMGGLNSCFSLPGLPKAARVSHLKSVMCLSFYELVGASSRDVVYLALPLYHMAGSLLGILGCLGIGERGWGPEGLRGWFWGADPPRASPRSHVRAEGEVLSQPLLGGLPRRGRHGVPVHRGAVPVPGEPAPGQAGGVPGGEGSRGVPPELTVTPQRPEERQHGLSLAVGSGLRPDVWRSFQQRFGPVSIVETYGMSEGNVTLFNYTGTPGAVGRCSFIYKVFGGLGMGGLCPQRPPVPLTPAPLRSSSRPSRLFVTMSLPELRSGTRPGAASAPARVRRGPGGLWGCPGCHRHRPHPAGETGLLIAPVTPRTPFLGYAGSRELSEQKLLRGVFTEGDEFFNTGDLVEQDRDQFVRFRDRIGDTFRCRSPPRDGGTPGAFFGLFSAPLFGSPPIPLLPVPSQVERRERGHHRGGRGAAGPRVPAGSHRLRRHRPR